MFTKHVPKFLQAFSQHTKASGGEHSEIMESAQAHDAKRRREGEDTDDEELRERHDAMRASVAGAPEMREHVLAEIAKELGNAAFKKGRVPEAIRHFSAAVDLEPREWPPGPPRPAPGRRPPGPGPGPGPDTEPRWPSPQ